MADTATQAPEIRPKRPIYSSYTEIIKTLTAEAIERIRQTKEPALPAPKISQATWRMVRRLVTLRNERHRLEARLRALNIQEDGGRVRWTYEYKNRLEAKPSARRMQRMLKARAYKVRATLDTLDMTPQQAKRYFLHLQQQLSRI